MGTPASSYGVFGLPAFSKELEEALEQGAIALGGCLVTDDDPDWAVPRAGPR